MVITAATARDELGIFDEKTDKVDKGVRDVDVSRWYLGGMLCCLLHLIDVPETENSSRKLNEAFRPAALVVSDVKRLAIGSKVVSFEKVAFHVKLLLLRFLQAESTT